MSALPSLCIEADQVAPQLWRNGGGRTRELLVWPSAADWRLRISRADIAASGPFSAFPGVARWFVVLSGHGVVLHMGAAGGEASDRLLLPGHPPLHFDGALAPGCTLVDGPTQDLNLMARGGQALVQTVEAGTPWRTDASMCGLYTSVQGVWTLGTHSQPVAAHTLLWWHSAPAATLQFTPGQPPVQPSIQATTEPSNPLPKATSAGTATAAWWLAYTPQD